MNFSEKEIKKINKTNKVIIYILFNNKTNQKLFELIFKQYPTLINHYQLNHIK